MQRYQNVSEVASELNITTTSVYKIINHADESKRLNPVNKTTYKGDGGYRFSREEVERIKIHYVRKDLTSAEAAKRIGRSTSFIHKLIHDGLIGYYVEELRGKKTYFIKEEELHRYEIENPSSGKTPTIYDRKSGMFLFQPFNKDGEMARIVEMKRLDRKKLEIKLLTDSDRLISYEDAIKEGWSRKFSIADKKPLTSFGYARFEFPRPQSLDSLLYTVIEELYKSAGAQNMKIAIKEKQLIVEVKKAVLIDIFPETHPDLIDKMKMFIKVGEIIPKYDGILIDTGLAPITFYLPDEKKSVLTANAEKMGMTLQEYIIDRL